MKELATVSEKVFNAGIEALFPELIKRFKAELERSESDMAQFFFLIPKDNENVKLEILSICKYFNNLGYSACVVKGYPASSYEQFQILISK